MTAVYDNRDMAEMDKYQTARIEALLRRIKELEAERDSCERRKDDSDV